jgi:hypothetical protein
MSRLFLSNLLINFQERKKNQPIFKLCEENLQIEDSYSYLGVIFNYNSSFVKARSKLMDEARKAYIVCIEESSICKFSSHSLNIG